MGTVKSRYAGGGSTVVLRPRVKDKVSLDGGKGSRISQAGRWTTEGFGLSESEK